MTGYYKGCSVCEFLQSKNLYCYSHRVVRHPIWMRFIPWKAKNNG